MYLPSSSSFPPVCICIILVNNHCCPILTPTLNISICHKLISATISPAMDCLVLPVSMWMRKSSFSRLGYQELSSDEGCVLDDSDSRVTVVVGKEKREFLVDPFVLQENPFRVLMETVRKDQDDEYRKSRINRQKRVVFVDVDSILFEHMLWLLHNDCSSLFQLNLKEIIDFYTQDY